MCQEGRWEGSQQKIAGFFLGFEGIAVHFAGDSSRLRWRHIGLEP